MPTLILKHFLFIVVMATIPTTSKLSASTSSGINEENKIGYETILVLRIPVMRLMQILVPGPLQIGKSCNT